MGELFGATVAMMLFGAIASWIVKKVTGIPAIPSYVVGVGIMTVLGGWLLSHDGFLHVHAGMDHLPDRGNKPSPDDLW